MMMMMGIENRNEQQKALLHGSGLGARNR